MVVVLPLRHEDHDLTSGYVSWLVNEFPSRDTRVPRRNFINKNEPSNVFWKPPPSPAHTLPIRPTGGVLTREKPSPFSGKATG